MINENKKEQGSLKIEISETLEKDIKIIIKYIIFIKEIDQEINQSKTGQIYKHNCYLTNKNLWFRYKYYFFYPKVESMIIEEMTNKNNLLNENLLNKIYSSLMQIFPDIYNKDKADSDISNIDAQENFEISYPEFFEIIDEGIYKDLKERFKKMEEKHFIKSEIIINNGKIIIKSDIKYNNNYLIIIGELENNNNIFNIKKFINFPEDEKRQEFFEYYFKNSYEVIMDKYKINKASTKVDFNIDLIDYNEKHIGDKMVKLFLFLYLFNKSLDICILDEIKKNGINFYYIINKNWMKIYKEYYGYNKLCEYFEKLKTNANYNNIVQQIKENIKNKNEEKINELIFNLIKDIPLDILKELENKKNDQKKLKEKIDNVNLELEFKKEKIKDNILKYYGTNEIIIPLIYELFNKIETDYIQSLLKEKSEKIKCLIGEKHLFIISEWKNETSQNISHFLNIGNIQDNIFKPSLLIYYSDKANLDNLIDSFNKNSFSEYIKNYNLIKKSSFLLKKEKDEIIGKICSTGSPLSKELRNIIEDPFVNSSQSTNFLKLIIYLKLFEIIKKSPIKNNKEQKMYYFNSYFINNLSNMNSYKTIKNYVNNNKEIISIISNNVDKNINQLSNLIIPKFDLKTLIKINEEKVNEKKYNYYEEYYYKNVNINNINKKIEISFENNFVLLNKEMYELFGTNYSNDIYFIGENKIFIPKKTEKLILIYNINDYNDTVNLYLILSFENSYDTILNQIINDGFNKFENLILPFDKEDNSPIFDLNQKKIGTAYKYSYKTDYNENEFCLKMRTMFMLYLNYKKILEGNNQSFNEYYIVNKNWIQKYKAYYDFDKIYNEFDKNNEIKKIINTLKDKENDDLIISDKNTILMLKSLKSDIINEFNEKDSAFNKKYENKEKKIADLIIFQYLSDNNQEKNLFFHYNFEIINAKIYKYLFENVDTKLYLEKRTRFFSWQEDTIENEEEKVFCLFDKDRIVIKLNQNNLIEDIKGMLYIVKIIPFFIYRIECFLIYNDIKLMEEHIQKINNSIGFSAFSEQFNKSKINIKQLKIGNMTCGYAIKKNQNKNYNIYFGDNDLITKYFTFPCKIGLNKIENAPNYINAIMQCLCNIEEFISLFKYDSYVKEIINKFTQEKKNFLTSLFKELIEKIWPEDENALELKEGHFEPKELYQKIFEMSSILKNNNSTNAEDFINFIMITLNEELNKNVINNQNNFIYNNNISYNNNYYLNAYYNFYAENIQKFNSKISDIFYGIKVNQNQCLRCGFINYNYQAYFSLSFSLKEIIASKLNNNKDNIKDDNKDNINNDKTLDILDCFAYYQKSVILEEDDQIYCESCKQNNNTKFTLNLFSSPKILIIIFEKNEDNENQIKLKIDFSLNISKYISNLIPNNKEIKYDLIGVVNDFNQNCIAHCLNPIDKEWYTYNDSKVDKVDNIGKLIKGCTNPYLLFYEKKE